MKIFATFALFLVLVLFSSEAVTVEEVEIKNDRLETELAALKNIVNMLQVHESVSVKELEKKNKRLEVELETMNDMFNELKAQVATKSDIADFAARLNDTSELEARVTVLEEDVGDLTDNVNDIESVNILQDLEERVEKLEEVTSQLTDDVSSLEDNDVTQDEIISSIEENVTSLDQRVEDLESSGGGNMTDYSDSIFMAVLKTNYTSSQDPLIFNYEAINPGGHYSNVTGKYTVPYDGIYQFSVHLQKNYNAPVYFYLKIDNSFDNSHVDYWTNEDYRSTTILLELTAGQTVHVEIKNGVRGDSAFYRSYFSGYLISPSN